MTTLTVEDLYPSRVHDKVAWLDRKDPVVYAEGTGSSGLSGAQIAHYEQHGYLFLEGFFNEQETETYRQEMKQMLDQMHGSNAREVILEPDGDEVRSIFNVHRIHDRFRDLTRHARLRAAVEHLLGSDVYVHQSRINFKPGFTGKEFYWHSDFETWHVEDGMPRMRALSCSIALEDNTLHNGALMVMPGSHRHFVSCIGRTPENHFQQSLRRQEYGVPDQASLTRLAEQGGIDMPVGKAGSLLLFDCNLMHGSNSNITPSPRSNVFIVFNSVENRLVSPFSGQSPRPEHIASRE